MSDTSRIEFTYEYQGFAAIQPLHPDSDRRKYSRRGKKQKEVFYQPKYPKFALGVVIDTNIEDIRQHGIRLQGKYTGKIRIELKEIKHGGKIQVGSLDYRDDLPQQFLFQIRRGRRYHDIWMGMPIAVFKIVMNLDIPSKQLKAIQKTIEMLEKLTPEEVAKGEVENQLEKMLDLLDMGLNIDEHYDKMEADDDERRRLNEEKEMLKKMIDIPGIQSQKKLIEKMMDEESEEYRSLIERKIETFTEEDMRKKWARQLGDLDQDILEDTKQKARKKVESRIRRKARRDLKLLKKSDNALDDIFNIFRFYFNIYLSSIKYLLGQFWMQLIPEWESELFFTQNEVRMNDAILVRQPVYRMGTLSQYAPSTNLSHHQWKSIKSLNFGQMMALSTGFTAEGIFVKAFEALRADEAEVCIVLLDIGLEFVFRNLSRNLSEQGRRFAEKYSLPDTTDRNLSFGDLLISCEKPLEKMITELGISKTKLRKLWAHIRYIHGFRNTIIHHKTIIRTYISKVLSSSPRERVKYELDPRNYSIDLQIDPENVSHFKPYWWRVINAAWYSAYDAFKMLNLIKWKFLTSKGYKPKRYPSFRTALRAREIVYFKLCSWLAKLFRVEVE